MMADLADLRLAFLLVVIAALVLFAAFPGIDLAVSAVFAEGRAGFPLADGVLAVVNLILRRIGELAALGLVVWVICGAWSGALRGDAVRAWGFAAGTVAVACGGIVNLVLKAHVGRARPDQLVEFGGGAAFTPAFQVTDQCARNCSFTSGEVALAASLTIAALVLCWPRLRRRGIAVAAGCGYVLVVAGLRIALGRHFASDAVFSVLVPGAVALVLYPLLRVGQARHGFDPVQPVVALGQLARVSRAALRSWLDRPV
jgi:lipid A 4'-phosphatase